MTLWTTLGKWLWTIRKTQGRCRWSFSNFEDIHCVFIQYRRQCFLSIRPTGSVKPLPEYFLQLLVSCCRLRGIWGTQGWRGVGKMAIFLSLALSNTTVHLPFPSCSNAQQMQSPRTWQGGGFSWSLFHALKEEYEGLHSGTDSRAWVVYCHTMHTELLVTKILLQRKREKHFWSLESFIVLYFYKHFKKQGHIYFWLSIAS